MVKKDYTIENVYQGGTDSFNPAYGSVFTGYRVAASEIGMTTDPRTANQLQALNTSLNQGAIPIEVGVLQPQAFDQIPKQHFEEMRRVAQLTGAKLSLHAPLIEPSGMGEQGWSEAGQKLAEQQLTDVIIRASDLDKNGNVPITIHSTGMPGSEYEITPEGKKQLKKLVIVDRSNGKPVQTLEGETLYYPNMERWKPGVTEEQKTKVFQGELSAEDFREKISAEQGKYRTPEQRLDILNHSHWDQEVTQLIFNKERADEILQQNYPQIQDVLGKLRRKEINFEDMTATQKQVYYHFDNARIYLEDNQQHVEALFNKAWKYGTEEDREKLKSLSKNFQEELNESEGSLIKESQAIQNLLNGMRYKIIPKQFVPVEEFAIDKSTETFANVAANAYKELGDKAPIISIENLMPGMAFALKKEGEKGLPGMNELILESKRKFVERVIKPKDKGGLGLSEKEAQKQADRIIGMTLDVGHLNIARKDKFKEEDLRKEVEAIARHVKHVHVTDNFGYSDSHLPPGMGNVPIKELLQELEKQGFSGRKILEVGGWFEHFKTSPYAESLAAMGSPIYSMKLGPYWNETINYLEGYMGGYGMMLPQTNYQTFGAGFAQLPIELGGQVGGGQGSRMSGKPME